MPDAPQALIEHLSAPACLLKFTPDQTPKIVAANEPWRKVTLLEPQDEGIALDAWLPVRSVGRIAMAVANLGPATPAETLDESLILPHGQSWWRMSLTQVGNPSDGLVMLSSTDITIRKRAELAWMRRVVEKEKVSRELSDFVSFAAHDLRAPLRNLRLLSEDLREKMGDDDQARVSILETMESVREGATRLINDVLSYAMSQNATPDRRTVDLSAMCQDLMLILDPLGEHSFSYPAEYVELDAIALQLALRNLFDNAIRHAGDDKLDIMLTLTPRAKMLEFTVTNTGTPVDPEIDIFGQTAGLLDGHGFGLRGLRRLLIGRGGRIWRDVDADRDGETTTIRFEIPGRSGTIEAHSTPEDQVDLAKTA